MDYEAEYKKLVKTREHEANQFADGMDAFYKGTALEERPTYEMQFKEPEPWICGWLYARHRVESRK